MMNKNNTRYLAMTAILAGGVGLLAAWWLQQHTPGSGTATTADKERKVLYWHDPMVPGYKSAKPGKSPFMDMDLVPVYEGDEDASTVTVRPEIANSLGIRTHVVARGVFRQELNAEGYLLREDGVMLVALDIFDRDAAWIRAGYPAKVRVYSAPGKEYDAVVQSVQPDIDVGLRTVRTRLRLLSADAALRPNFAAQVTVFSPPSKNELAVPREAIIRTGTRTSVVLSLGEGRFSPADVVTGRESGEWVEITKGVQEGDKVVVSGQFLLDSEASVRASFARMQTGEPAAPPMDHTMHAPAAPAQAPAANPHAGH